MEPILLKEYRRLMNPASACDQVAYESAGHTKFIVDLLATFPGFGMVVGEIKVLSEAFWQDEQLSRFYESLGLTASEESYTRSGFILSCRELLVAQGLFLESLDSYQLLPNLTHPFWLQSASYGSITGCRAVDLMVLLPGAIFIYRLHSTEEIDSLVNKCWGDTEKDLTEKPELEATFLREQTLLSRLSKNSN